MAKPKEVGEDDLSRLRQLLQTQIGGDTDESWANGNRYGTVMCFWYKVYRVWNNRVRCSKCNQMIEKDQPYSAMYQGLRIWETPGRAKFYHLIDCFDSALADFEARLLQHAREIRNHRTKISGIKTILQSGEET